MEVEGDGVGEGETDGVAKGAEVDVTALVEELRRVMRAAPVDEVAARRCLVSLAAAPMSVALLRASGAGKAATELKKLVAARDALR